MRFAIAGGTALAGGLEDTSASLSAPDVDQRKGEREIGKGEQI